MDYFQFTNKLQKDYRRTIRDAESLAKKPRLVQERGISRAVRFDQAVGSISVNDILEKMDATTLMFDPLMKKRLKDLSSINNTTKSRY